MSAVTGKSKIDPAVAPADQKISPPSSPLTGDSNGGIGKKISSIASWGPVKTARESTVWSVISWPFSAIGSVISSVWARISNRIWGKPESVALTVKIEFQGWFGPYTLDIPTERAIRKGWLSVEKGVADGSFKLERAQINGWTEVTVDVPARLFGAPTPTKMMLKTAIQNGYMSVQDAIPRYITQDQAAKADWIKKN